jgi:hypothetical protein
MGKSQEVSLDIEGGSLVRGARIRRRCVTPQLVDHANGKSESSGGKDRVMTGHRDLVE